MWQDSNFFKLSNTQILDVKKEYYHPRISE